jgi:hypothetical protein
MDFVSIADELERRTGVAHPRTGLSQAGQHQRLRRLLDRPYPVIGRTALLSSPARFGTLGPVVKGRRTGYSMS